MTSEPKRADDGTGAPLAALRIVHEIDRAILAADSVAELAARTVTGVRELTGADRVAFVSYDLVAGTADRLAVSWSEGGPDETPGTGPLAGILGDQLLRRPEPVVYPRLAEALGTAPGASVMLDQGLTAGAFVPLLADGRLLGALVLGGRDAGFLTGDNLAVVREVADRLAIATVHAQAREQLERSVVRLELVHQIDSGILETLTTTQVAERVADRTRLLLGADRLSVVAYDLEREQATVLAVSPVELAGAAYAGLVLPLDLAAPPQLRSRRDAAVYPDLDAVVGALPAAERLLALGMTACAFVPLVAGDRLVGALIAAGRTPSFITGERLRVAREVGNQLAIAIEHARAGEALARSVLRLRIIHEIDQAILEATSIPQLAERAVASVREFMGAGRVAFATYDLRNGVATHVAGARAARSSAEHHGRSTPLAALVAPDLLANPRAVVTQDFATTLDLLPGAAALVAEGLPAGAWIPMIAGDRLVGTLVLAGADGSFLTEEHLAVAREVADQLAVAVLHAEARAQLEHSVARLELVHEIDRSILSSRMPGEIALGVVERLRRLVGAGRVEITGFNPEAGTGRVLAVAEAGSLPVAGDEVDVPLADHAPAERWQRRAVIPYADLAAVADELPAGRRGLALGHTLGATVPLLAGERLIGVVTLSGDDPAILRPDTLAIAREVGDQLAVALQHVRDRDDLADSESRLRTILEASPNGVLTVDASARIRYANPAAHDVFRAAAGELVGRVVYELVPSPSTVHLEEQVGQWFTADLAGVRPHPIDTEGRRLDGTTFPVHVLLARVDTAGGRLAIVTVVDLTERAGLEARLRQSARLEVLGQFAGILAHDVRNFLATVSWSAELLADTLEAEHPAHRDVELIQRAAQDGIAMTRSVLEFARPSGDARGVTDAAAHLAQTRTMLERVLGDGVRLEVAAAPGLPPAGINAAALTQVLVNLATNARDAMPNGGLLRIEVELHAHHGNGDGALLEPGPYVRLVVSDTGTGMDETTRRRAFDAFYTTKAGASTTEGTGLGLASVFLIVSRTGGDIRVESVPGTGTTFTVDIPVA